MSTEMNPDGELFLKSILEESPIFSALSGEERHIVLEYLKKTHPDYFVSYENEVIVNQDDWFRKRL